jgi:Protein of unknown function (DUF3263)
MSTLPDADKALLDFAARWYRFPGAQEQAMRDELGMSDVRARVGSKAVRPRLVTGA